MNDEPRPREHTTHTGGVQGPQTFQWFLAQTFSEPHRHMPSYPECHVFESHRRYQNGAPQRYAPEKPRRCLGFSFPERVRGANGLP